MEPIEKEVYSYDSVQDRVVQSKARNIAFTTKRSSYTQACERKGPTERAAYFFKEDIFGKSILDFGCDDGGVLLSCLELGAEKVTGVDYNPQAIDIAKKTARARSLQDAFFFCADIENKAFLTTLEKADTVLLLSVLGTSEFSSQQSVIAAACRFAKHVMYLEGHYSPESRVRPLFELLMFTDFTKFEYLGRNDLRILLRCSRELLSKERVPHLAITSDDPLERQYEADEIYIHSHSKKFPVFSRRCRLIQYVSS